MLLIIASLPELPLSSAMDRAPILRCTQASDLLWRPPNNKAEILLFPGLEHTPSFIFHYWLALFCWHKFTPYRSSCSVKKSVLCEHASIRSALMQCPELFLQGWSLDCNKCQISVINPSPPKLQKPLRGVYFQKANTIEKSPPRHLRS